MSTLTDREALHSAFSFLPLDPPPAHPPTSPNAVHAARLAAAYSASLNMEFALCDTSRCASASSAALGLRWRTRAEVARGKGATTCGALGCAAVAGLHTFEVPFAWEERGAERSALVKLRVCGGCAALAFQGAAR